MFKLQRAYYGQSDRGIKQHSLSDIIEHAHMPPMPWISGIITIHKAVICLSCKGTIKARALSDFIMPRISGIIAIPKVVICLSCKGLIMTRL